MVKTATSQITSGKVALLGILAFTAGLLGNRLFAEDTSYANVSSDVTFTIPGYARDHFTWPIVINGLEIDGKQIPLDTPVHLTGHWLAHLAVIVNNISTKHIVWAGTFLTFPETGNGSPTHPLFSCCAAMIGREPDISLYLSNGTKRQRYPDEAAETPVDILPARVWFSDDTHWGVSNYYAPAGAPGKWTIASPNQFLSNGPATPISSVSYVPMPGGPKKPEEAMLPVGARAPDFSLPSPNGPQVSLAVLRKQSKITLVNFWSLDCAPCLLEFPEFEKLYQQFHRVGLNMVAVDWHDAAQPVSDYATRTGLTFPIALDGYGNIFETYKVPVLPTSYLIYSDGRILYRLLGADPDALRAELAKLGFK